jgi:Tfp pilus assembly protein PilN
MNAPSAARRRTPQQINLVDPRLLRVRQRLPGAVLLLVMGIGTTVVGLHYAVEKYQLQRQIASLSARSSAPETATPMAAPGPSLLAKQEQLAREEMLREALSQGDDLPSNTGALLNAVVQALPGAVWLTDLQVLGQKSLVITGGTLERPALATFSQQLEASPVLQGTPIGIVQLTPHHGSEEDGSADYGRSLVDSGNNGRGGGNGSGNGNGRGAAAPPTHFAFTLASRSQTGNTPSSLVQP